MNIFTYLEQLNPSIIILISRILFRLFPKSRYKNNEGKTSNSTYNLQEPAESIYNALT